jgi:dihydropteroate synthase
MGVLNVTPDSFSDGGKYAETTAAIKQGERLLADGADILDIGGESTRPGAQRVSPNEELQRVLPVIENLAATGAVISIDTMNSAVAEQALNAGAQIINDVSGGQNDPRISQVVAESGATYVLGHWRGFGQLDPHSTGEAAGRASGPVSVQVKKTSPSQIALNQLTAAAGTSAVCGESTSAFVSQVCADLTERLIWLEQTGVRREQIVVDPGLGFAKTSAQNWDILAHLPQLQALGFPVLIGASRKRFLKELLGSTPELAALDNLTATVSALSALQKVWAVRVHNVTATRQALTVTDKWTASNLRPTPNPKRRK